MDGVAAEERGRSAAGGMGWLDIGNGVGKMASAGGVGAAASCAASASKAWVVAWLAASSLPSPVAALVDNVVGNVGRHRQSGAGRHLEMELGPANEQEGQNVRAWRVGVNMPGLGMRSGGCGCEIQGSRGAGGWLWRSR